MNEQEIKQALATLELYRAQAEALAEQQQIIQFSLDEYTRARDTLGKWKDAEPDAELLVPVGGNSFVFAKVADSKRALVGVGSGVTVERSVEDAIKTLETRTNELAEAAKKVNESLFMLEQRSAQLQQAVQAEYERMQQKF
ncbi:MAG: prefoldin subunit alpha [Methanomassiliicoccales archaeon]|nr:prefoldin subunit alpha [Methanomassiliicoccales archaeon]